MTLEELQESANRDLKIDETDLGSESINIPILHNKYLQHFNKFSLLLKKAEYDHRVLKRQKWEYYTGKSDPSVYKEKPFDLKILKADVHIYMDSDEELQKADQKEAYLRQVVNYLEQLLRSINSRNFVIKNAIDSMNGKGTIEINVIKANSNVQAEIKDSGKGILKENLKKIFNPGFSLKKKGWGLGLSLSKRIINLYHSGKIYVKESKINSGSILVIRLPLFIASS